MRNKTKQTAVELFAIALYEKGFLTGNGDEIQELLEQGKEMEKEQIEDAYKRGWDSGNFGSDCWEEIYYNETYGGNKVECQFEMDTSTSSATKCKFCGKEKWQHINGGNK